MLDPGLCRLNIPRQNRAHHAGPSSQFCCLERVFKKRASIVLLARGRLTRFPPGAVTFGGKKVWRQSRWQACRTVWCTPQQVPGGIPKKEGTETQSDGQAARRQGTRKGTHSFHLSFHSTRPTDVYRTIHAGANQWRRCGSLFSAIRRLIRPDERRPGGNTVCRCLDVSFGEPELCLS